MKKIFLALSLVFGVFVVVQAQQPIFSFSVKSNYNLVNTSTNFDNDIFEDIFINAPISEQLFFQSSFPSGNDGAVVSFELGVDVALPISKRLALMGGLYFHQLRYRSANKTIFFVDNFSPDFNPIFFTSQEPSISVTNIIDYIKIPFGIEYSAVPERLFLRTGFFGSMIYGSKIKVKDNSPNPRLFPPSFVESDGTVINPNTIGRAPFNDVLMGIQLGLRLRVFSKLSLVMDYARGINSVTTGGSFSRETMNTFALGLSWQVN